MIKTRDAKTEYRIGLLCAIGCALLWGVLPVYWKMLQSVDSFIIMFYRLVLACIFVLIICLIVYKPKGIVEPLKKKRAALTFFLAGLIIATNWGIYIWAVNAGFIIQTSIGYYIEPLFVCFAGVLFFHEKINVYKIIAIVLATIGVMVMVISYGQVPFIALGLAVTFALYAVIKKYLQAPALLALLYETGLLLPIIIPVLIWMEVNGNGVIGNAGTHQLVLLSFVGVITAIPLLLFAMAANRISIITLGITEYIAPSVGLVLGIFVYKEPFDIVQLIGFIIIWIGLVFFTFGGLKAPEVDRIP